MQGFDWFQALAKILDLIVIWSFGLSKYFGLKVKDFEFSMMVTCFQRHLFDKLSQTI